MHVDDVQLPVAWKARVGRFLALLCLTGKAKSTATVKILRHPISGTPLLLPATQPVPKVFYMWLHGRLVVRLRPYSAKFQCPF